MKSWTQRETHIAAIVDHARSCLPAADAEVMAAFIRAFYKTVSPDDVAARPPELLYGIALSMWQFAARREPDAPRVRVFNPTLEEHGWHSPHTVVQMVNDDMPFLVDSVTGNLALGGTEIHFVCHPVMSVARDGDGQRLPDTAGSRRESLIYLEIDRKTAPETLKLITERILAVLADIRVAVADWREMRGAVGDAIADLEAAHGSLAAEDVNESRTFLEWLLDNHFTFLGYRRYSHVTREGVAERGLGLLRDPERQVFRDRQTMIAVSQEVRDFLASPVPMIVTKANVKSTVHRPVHLDYIGLKRYDGEGRVIGEHRFVGLFTSVALNRRVQNIPYLRQKVARVIALAGFDPQGHDGKSLLHILETFPRDELFQVDPELLFDTAISVLYLLERPHARAFLRQDKYERFVSALVYVPRELYESNLRSRIEAILCGAFNGEIAARHAQLSDDVIARWHFIIRTRPGEVPAVDPEEINACIATVARGWRDHLKEALIARQGEERGLELFDRYAQVFSPAYRDVFSVEFAAVDIEKMEAAAGPDGVQYHFYRLPEDRKDSLRLKIYHPSAVIPLSDCMPLLENLGLRVIEEFAYDVNHGLKDRARGCIHSFYLEEPRGLDIPLSETRSRLEETLHRVATEEAENDGFNALVLRAGLTWRQVVILRAYAKFMRQLGISYSEDHLRACLTDHPQIACLLVALFEARFDPQRLDSRRQAENADLQGWIQSALEGVPSLDQDSILRSFRNLIFATLRTNCYQRDGGGALKSALAFKIDSRELKEAPLPRPFAEIFVYAPRVEGVHLRAGPVARGGLRWSDRPEDFRTEVLGLVKAQQVKNAVIVPVGAKGGFYPKRLPRNGDRDAIYAEGLASYQTFIGALLDVTDNLVEDKVVPPHDVVRHDNDDPYLVVAADKGTASFSDYANAIAEARGFWLDDAFASGGSNGYDHKKMAITARGAWVSVERHFRERGVDIRETGITVAGIGDMSGDVFGNGMLLSDKIRLRAAFDHRHIFLDPDPDPAASFHERQRLFALPRSSWADYDTTVLSPGGAIIDRKAKSISLSPEIRAVLAIADETLTPGELVQAVLRAPVDLLWIGGIGTFVKSSAEAHRDVGDRGNDPVRVNASELRCRVVGEGGNLGFTQRARVEYARLGGSINTDAIDNSGGVDCSDREVNIKILLNAAHRDGRITRDQRDKLLIDMTGEVAALVLDDNYLQTLSLTLEQAISVNSLDLHRRLIANLEKTVALNRALEFLPTDNELNERRLRQEGLTRPELAVVMAYAKMELKQALLKSKVVDDPYLISDLARAFPDRLGAEYRPALKQHRLRREIIATLLANQVINRLGAGFAMTVMEEVDSSLADVGRAFVVVRDLYGLVDLWREIDALDNRVPAAIQALLYLDVVDFTRRFVIWTLKRSSTNGGAIAKTMGPLSGGIAALSASPLEILGGYQLEVLDKKTAVYREQGVPAALAARVAALEAHAASGDIVEVAASLKRPVEDVAAAYFFLGNMMGFNWLKGAAENLAIEDHWERLAASAIVEDLLNQQRSLTRRLLAAAADKDGLTAAKAWTEASGNLVQRIQSMITEFHAAPVSLAKLGYAARQLRTLLC